MNEEKYLPLGSVVRAKGNIKKIMIIGRGLFLKEQNSTEEEGKYYDYGAVFYPEGMMGESFIYLMHEDIDEIVFKGYEDEDNSRMIKVINEAIAKQIN